MMSQFDEKALQDFYSAISTKSGLEVVEFQSELRRLFGLPRSKFDLNEYRLGKPPWKKLSDEITPVSHHLTFAGIERGRIRFPLDNEPPDCWLQIADEPDWRGIEVTVAQGTERYHLATELIEKGSGRGFIGLSDDAPRAEFRAALERPRTMYSTTQALDAVKLGILRCLERKNDRRFAGYDLLIQAPLRLLQDQRWELIEDELLEAATQLPFREIHLISNADGRPWGFRIK